MKKILIMVSILIAYSGMTQGQNLEQYSLKKGVQTTGSVSLNAVGYTSQGRETGREPFTWFLNANLNLNLFGYNAPFTFSYSNTQSTFTQPFNQITFNPQYKWVKVYTGNTNMNFSNYTLAGHLFFGGGVELTPGKWRFTAVYGRFKKAVGYDLQDSTQYTQASYKRMGYGFKIGYEGDNESLQASIFGAKDDVSSLQFTLPESQLTPKQNLALSIAGRKRLWGKLQIEGEYAVSVLNNNLLASESDSAQQIKNSNIIKGLLPQSSTNRYYDALNLSLGYQGNHVGLQLKFERIAPEYQTLGAYFFNNDLQNITLAPSVKLLNNSLQINANVGIQRNNLDESRASTTKRFVGAFNVNFTPNQQWNLAANYSNFTTFTNIRTPNDPFNPNPSLDTLNFYQITHNAGSTLSYQFGNKEHRQALVFNANYQRTGDKATTAEFSNSSDFYTGNMAYTYTIAPQQLSLSAGLNYYTNRAGSLNTNYWGPTINLSKSMFNKSMKQALSIAYNHAETNQVSSGDVLNLRWNVSYQPQSSQTASKKNKEGRHNLNFSLNYVKRFRANQENPTQNQLGFSEWTGTLGYVWSF
jgi:hypothetical protein